MRRPHRKTRTGCKQCKERRIKCDERKPRCSYCERHSTLCSYQSVAAPPISPGSSKIPSSSKSIETPSELASKPVPERTLNLHCTDLHIDDLELLHHYMTSTYETFVRTGKSVEVWKHTVPKLAFKHPFLIHGIFAVSALHLAALRPEREKEYMLLATKYQDLALPVFRTSILHVDKDNCDAMVVFANLVAAYALGSLKPSKSVLYENGGPWGIAEWLQLLRGIFSAFGPVWVNIASGPLAPLLDRTPSKGPLDFTRNPDDHYLTTLDAMLSDSLGTSLERAEELEIYRTAIDQLRQISMIPYAAGDFVPKSAPFMWPIVVSQSYITLLNERKPEALILFAHQCVLLKKAEPAWHIDGHALRLITVVYESLDPDWRQWIKWPMEMVGLDEKA